MDLMRSSDITTMMAKIKVASEKWKELAAELANWKIYVAVQVAQGVYDGLSLNVSVAKTNGRGFIYEIPPSSIAQYADDPETLIGLIAEKVYENLFKDQIRSELAPHLIRALENATQKKNV